MIFEDAAIIEMNISHYRTLLKLDMADERRAAIKTLLAKAMEDLTLSKNRTSLQQQRQLAPKLVDRPNFAEAGFGGKGV